MATTRVFVGIDWGHEKHQVCAVDADGTVLFDKVIRHTQEELSALCDRLIEQVHGQLADLAACIERPNGIVVETLLERGITLFAINPKQLDRFRDRFSMSGAKDDRRDARVLADSLRTDRRAFRELQPEHELVIQIREASRVHSETQQERVRQSNRLREQMLRYYPAFVEAVGDPSESWALALWQVIPTPRIASKVRVPTLARVLKEHRIRKTDAHQLATILKRPPMTVAPGTETAVVEHIRLLNDRVRMLNAQQAHCRKRIEALLADYEAVEQPGENGEQPVVTIAMSLPGIGPTVLAGLLAEAAEPLGRGDYHALRALSGVAPVTRSSGKSRTVLRRFGANHRLADALFHIARVAVVHDPLAKAKYTALRARGHTYGRALRSVGDRILQVLCAMIRTRQTFDPNRRTAAVALLAGSPGELALPMTTKATA